MSIAQFAVTRRVTVAMMATAIVVLGIFALPRLPISLLPTFSPPVVTVTVNYGTVAPQTMESAVTRIVENAVSRVSGIDYLQSDSFQGTSVVRAVFKFGTDINVAAVDIQQQISRVANQLPNDPNLQQPIIQKADPNGIPVVRLFISDTVRPMRELSDLFANQLNDEFAAVAGVGSVFSSGGQVKSIMIEPKLAQLAGYGLDPTAIVNKIKAENVDTPAGFISVGPREFLIRTSALFTNAAEMRDIVISVRNGTPVYLRDVATVRDDIQEQRQFSRLNNTPALGLNINAQPDANVVAVAAGVYAKIDELQKRYPTMKFGVAFEQRGFILDAITALLHTAAFGAVLAILVILLFLHSWRSTLIVAISLPVSVLGTFFAAFIFHQSLNVMTLGGLALAVGLIVDDAVVVIENIYRHLARGESPLDAARNATTQILTAVMASSITVVTVFVPLLLIPGLQGLIFGPFAMIVMTAIAISLLIAVTTVPMLSSIFLKASDANHGVGADGAPPQNWYGRFSAAFDRAYLRLESGYKWLLQRALDRPVFVLGTGVLLLVLAIAAIQVGIVKTENFPASDSRFVRFDVRMPNGTSLAVTNEGAQMIERAVRKDKRVVNVGVTVGSAFTGGGTRNVGNQIIFFIELREDVVGPASSAFVNEWQRRLGGSATRGGGTGISQPVDPQGAFASLSPEERAERIALRRAMIGTVIRGRTIDIVQQILTQGSDALQIQIFGRDLNKLYSLAQGVIPEIAALPGVLRPDTNYTPATPELDIKIDRRKAAQHGFTTGDIGNALATATTGTIASYFQVNGIQYPILVELAQNDFKTYSKIESLELSMPSAAITQTGVNVSPLTSLGLSPSGSMTVVPLAAIADLSYGTGPSQVSRQNKQRRIDINANVIGRPIGEVVGLAGEIMQKYPLPDGYRWDFGPSIKQNADTFKALGLVVVLAIALIYMLLASQFESLLDPLVIMMAVPFSVIGIIGSLFVTHRAFGLTAFIGSLLLVGIAVKNAILVVEFTKQLRRQGMSAREALMHAGPLRLRPILMTTLATFGGMLPLALGIEAGSATQAPLGTVVIGGLLTSTLLSLVVVPTLYLLVATHIEPRFSGGVKLPSFRRNGHTPEVVSEPEVVPVHG